jgi:acetolactate synthase regulatory subunit
MLPSSDATPTSTACFAVEARPEPGVMPRVLELFAKRGFVPTQWHSSVGGAGRGQINIDIEIEGMDTALAEYIARCLRQLADVESVLTSEKRYAQSA